MLLRNVNVILFIDITLTVTQTRAKSQDMIIPKISFSAESLPYEVTISATKPALQPESTRHVYSLPNELRVNPWWMSIMLFGNLSIRLEPANRP